MRLARERVKYKKRIRIASDAPSRTCATSDLISANENLISVRAARLCNDPRSCGMRVRFLFIYIHIFLLLPLNAQIERIAPINVSRRKHNFTRLPICIL